MVNINLRLLTCLNRDKFQISVALFHTTTAHRLCIVVRFYKKKKRENYPMARTEGLTN